MIFIILVVRNNEKNKLYQRKKKLYPLESNNCKCSIHEFFREFRQTFNSKWMNFFEKKIFRQRLYKIYKN